MFQLKRPHGAPLTVLLALYVLALMMPAVAFSVELIVHPGVPETSLTHAESRGIFTGRISHWTNGKAIRVFVLPEHSALHQSFAKKLLDMFPYQLKAAWNRIIYTGIGQAPIMVSSEGEMLRMVAETPGAIGYISEVQLNDKVRVLPIR